MLKFIIGGSYSNLKSELEEIRDAIQEVTKGYYDWNRSLYFGVYLNMIKIKIFEYMFRLTSSVKYIHKYSNCLEELVCKSDKVLADEDTTELFDLIEPKNNKTKYRLTYVSTHTDDYQFKNITGLSNVLNFASAHQIQDHLNIKKIKKIKGE